MEQRQGRPTEVRPPAVEQMCSPATATTSSEFLRCSEPEPSSVWDPLGVKSSSDVEAAHKQRFQRLWEVSEVSCASGKRADGYKGAVTVSSTSDTRTPATQHSPNAEGSSPNAEASDTALGLSSAATVRVTLSADLSSDLSAERREDVGGGSESERRQASTTRLFLAHARGGEFRRRLYENGPALGRGASEAAAAAAAVLARRAQGELATEAARGDQNPFANDETVLIEGPMQQRGFMSWWRWRWCVLQADELRIYRNLEASILQHDRPQQRFDIETLRAATDLHHQTVLVFERSFSADSGTPISLSLRTGSGQRWEEIAAASLW